MNNWDPGKHPRDMRTGQFSESWIAAVDATMSGSPSDRPDWVRDAMREVKRQYDSRSFQRDITTWSYDKLMERTVLLDVLLAGDDEDSGEVWAPPTGDELEEVTWVRGAVAREADERQKTPPWEGGAPDTSYRHYEAWVKAIREEIEERGYDPDAEIVLARIPWDDDPRDDPTAEYYIDVEMEDPQRLVEGELGDMEIEDEPDSVRAARNAIGVHKQAMESYDHPGAKEINLHLLAAHPDFSSSGLFEIYVPEVNDWALMEDQDWNEADELLTIWAGDYHYELDIDDEASYIRRIRD